MELLPTNLGLDVDTVLLSVDIILYGFGADRIWCWHKETFKLGVTTGINLENPKMAPHRDLY